MTTPIAPGDHLRCITNFGAEELVEGRVYTATFIVEVPGDGWGVEVLEIDPPPPWLVYRLERFVPVNDGPTTTVEALIRELSNPVEEQVSC